VRDGWAGDGQDDPPAAQSPQNPQQNSEPDSKEKPAARRGGINRADLSQAAKLEIDVKKLRKELAAVRKELKDLKETPASDNIVFEVIRLRNAKAQNVTSVLNNLFQGNPLLVLPVEDNNSLLVKGASPADFKKIQNLVETVLDRADVDSNAVIRTRIIGPLKYARAADVAKILCAISDDGSVAVDERTNSLVLTCDTATIAERAKLVEQMEKAARDVPPSGPRVITLKSASAAEMAKLLRELYRDAGKSSGFSAAAFGGRLVLRCSPELAQEIEALVRELDVK
jgi:type II secretory pathway component GspD/PulD (secretin)